MTRSRQHDLGSPIAASEITPRSLFEQRRMLLQGAGMLGLAGLGLGAGEAAAQSANAVKLAGKLNPQYAVPDKLTSYRDITNYNNYYEFGTDKSAPSSFAASLKTRPWTVSVEGMVKKPASFGIDDLLKLAPIEERVYRLRCVEAWSMVIPWLGYSLSELLRKVEPLPGAKFVEFISLADKAQMPGVSDHILAWPYTEGLRLDEAMHPLTMLGLGLYGEVLPKQNGAPVRLVVPWKYGFKSAKSIVKIRLTDKQPATSWNLAAPQEYGFYSNVNPDVDHPRWSPANERRIGDQASGGGLFAPRRKTLPFNGYAEQVAGLYAGMDLKKFF
ncbi:MAG: protein-methionine-sulfoxide reductase catalytic subunit MsrP [Candidatus Protistobacter heckmanni]|nr:protein-methionine-sulfoxide reductase catalytic subunit MsrP [Candidatus Protistobacter heckmanni]